MDAAPDIEHELRATESPTRAGDWELVLASAGIAYRLDQRDGRFVVVVAARDAEAATAALAAFDVESVAVVMPPAPDLGPSALGAAAAIGVLAVYYVTGGRDAASPSRWFAAGSASAELILRGEWWRTVTALTLHADLKHVVWNAVACLVFITAVGRWLGPGLGGLLVVGTAALANLGVALVKRHDYASVGASTATFAALGLLAGLQLVRRWRYDQRRRYWWLPLGAGLGFALMAVSPQADIWAHFLGLGVGALAGAALAAKEVRPPGRLGQALLVLGVSAVLIGAWLLGFRATGGWHP